LGGDGVDVDVDVDVEVTRISRNTIPTPALPLKGRGKSAAIG
jgi:hypothetical protein